MVARITCASSDELPFDSFINYYQYYYYYDFSLLLKLQNQYFPLFSGKLLGCYFGKCSGSIRSIVRHPDLPLIASCGEATSRKALDSFYWDACCT
jgi:hypothetical protein